MKKIHRVLALLMAALMALGLMTTAFAATDSAPTIDPSKKASLSIYKYDITKASNDGAWDAESYVSAGLRDDAVIDKLSKYTIQGVEFTYLRIADITMNNEVMDGQRTVGVLYGFDSSDRSTDVLSAIGLTAADAHKTEGGINYFTSDVLNNKLSTALTANATTVKNALETAVKNGGVAMTETDVTGHTFASDMEQGLYLVVETRVPENVTSTCNPFLMSLPMTSIDGAAWNYDVTVYPKNQTGNPDLEKTVREAKNSTGKNTGSLTDITDGYAHTATASVGDVVDYPAVCRMLCCRTMTCIKTCALIFNVWWTVSAREKIRRTALPCWKRRQISCSATERPWPRCIRMSLWYKPPAKYRRRISCFWMRYSRPMMAC